MITSIYERVRDSLFALPAVLIAGLGAFSWVARRLDALLPADTPWLLPTTVDSTRAILSTVATATITVAGIVFSMTAVVVQLATTQLSPRVTQGLLRDRYQQITIGVSVGTFVYALLVLADVHGTEERPFSTHDFSATLAVALGVVSLLFIVYFIDRTMRMMRIDTVIRRLADATESAIGDLPDRGAPADGLGSIPSNEAGTTVDVTRTGWVTGVDFNRILAAVPEETVVRVDLRVGDFITRREVAARTWPAVDSAAAEAIAASIATARTRTIANDPSYGIRQLVDIALRALSPSLNDATTGSDVVHHLGGPVQALILRDLPGRVLGDDGGRRIYMPRALTHSDYIHAAFREIRLTSAGQPHVLHALVETLASLIAVARAADRESRVTALQAEANATLAVVEESGLPEADREYVLEFARQLGLAEAE